MYGDRLLADVNGRVLVDLDNHRIRYLAVRSSPETFGCKSRRTELHSDTSENNGYVVGAFKRLAEAFRSRNGLIQVVLGLNTWTVRPYTSGDWYRLKCTVVT